MPTDKGWLKNVVTAGGDINALKKNHYQAIFPNDKKSAKDVLQKTTQNTAKETIEEFAKDKTLDLTKGRTNVGDTADVLANTGKNFTDDITNKFESTNSTKKPSIETDDVLQQKLNGTSEQKPKETPEQKTNGTPEQRSDKTSEQKSKKTLEQKPNETSEQKPKETPEQKPGEILKRGDNNGVTGFGRVEISGKKLEFDVDEVKTIGKEDKVNIDDITKKKANDKDVTSEASTQVKAKMLEKEIQVKRSTVIDGKTAFERNLEAKLTDYGISLEEFNTLRVKDVATLTEKERDILKELRDISPKPKSGTLLQKVVPASEIENYLGGTYTKLKGFVTRFEDVAHLKTYDEIYDSLRLDYGGSAFKPETDAYMGAIRFKSEDASEFSAAFNELLDGHCKGDPPFTGNGFTKSTNGRIIPEFESPDLVQISDGSLLVKIYKNGEEEIVAIYNKNIDGGRFIPIE